MLLERRSLARPSAKAEAIALVPADLAQLCEAVEGHRKAPCQYDIYARSGRAADAVREHSFCSSPTRSGSAALEHPPLSFFASLTPARLVAMSLAAQFSGPVGSGVVVLARTAQNQRQNRQVTDIAKLLPLVPGFQRFASRDVRSCVHVSTCAYVCARNARTSEPTNNIYVNHIDSGSKSGSARFSPEPALRGAGLAHGFASISNILIGGYAPAALDRPSRGLMLSRLGESFGVFGLGASADRASASSSTRRARNGGKAWVFGRASVVVGTLLLERRAQSRRNARFFGADRLPSGKARGTPPCPLSRSQPPSWRWRSTVSEFGSASPLLNAGPMPRLEKSPRGRFRQTGSGEASRSAAIPARMSGRGEADAAGKLRRMTCMGGGISRVK